MCVSFYTLHTYKQNKELIMYQSIFDLIKDLMFDGIFPTSFAEQYTTLIAMLFTTLMFAIPIMVIVALIMGIFETMR